MFKNIKFVSGISLALAILMLAAAFCGCRGCAGGTDDPKPTEPAGNVDDTDVPTEAPTGTPDATDAPGITVAMREDPAAVKAVATGTFGVASDGTLRFMGRAVSGQNLIYGWSGVAAIAANDDTVAVLKRDGAILHAQTEETIPFTGTARWTNTVDIAMGDGHFVGLASNGRVLALGDNSNGQTEVSSWSGVSRIAAAGAYTAAIAFGRVLTTLGEEFNAQLEGLEAKDIAAARDHLAVLLADGTVRSFAVNVSSSADSSTVSAGFGRTDAEPTENEEYDWTGIERIAAADGGATYAIDGEGVLHTNSELITETVENVYLVSATATHAVVLHGDGLCEGFGDNTDMQINVAGWRLLPYVTEEGWLLGNTLDGRKGTGMAVTYENPATGERREAVCVVLGDVNGDGRIDSADVDAVNAHIDGTSPLEGAYLRAANVIMDGSEPDSVDVNDLDLIIAHSTHAAVIDQYAKTDMYTDLLADARRLNPDALGYITIEGTNISYPIMYDADWYYNDHDIEGRQTKSGSIYFYWGKPNRNIVITGHNSRTSGTMFHELHDVQNRCDDLIEYENRLWYINVYGQSGWWEVWAMYEEPAFKNAEDSSQYYNTCWPNTFNVLSDEEKQAWIEYQLGKNELGYSVRVSIEDRFMTIVTCGDSHQDAKRGARLYFFLRWVGSN